MKAYFAGGRYNGLEIDTQVILESNLWNGELTEDLSEIRARGGCVHRAELDNQPMVDGYLSPMWDGDGLRYETQEVYDMLSR